jgi:hypothetical protein
LRLQDGFSGRNIGFGDARMRFGGRNIGFGDARMRFGHARIGFGGARMRFGGANMRFGHANMRFGHFLGVESLGKGNFISPKKDKLSYSKRNEIIQDTLCYEDFVLLQALKRKTY